MNIATIMQQTSDAKVAHIRWVKKADHLISGLPVEKEFIPLEPTDCVFGKWLYSQGSQLRTQDSLMHLIEKIEKYHDELHDIYGKIYQIYFMMPQHRTLLQKIITFNSKEVTQNEIKEAKQYYAILEQISEKLLLAIKEFEVNVKELNYDDLKNQF